MYFKNHEFDDTCKMTPRTHIPNPKILALKRIDELIQALSYKRQSLKKCQHWSDTQIQKQRLLTSIALV